MKILNIIVMFKALLQETGLEEFMWRSRKEEESGWETEQSLAVFQR